MYADVVSGTTTVHGFPRMRLAYAAAYPAQPSKLLTVCMVVVFRVRR
jgi:hypothetical protein